MTNGDHDDGCIRISELRLEAGAKSLLGTHHSCRVVQHVNIDNSDLVVNDLNLAIAAKAVYKAHSVLIQGL